MKALRILQTCTALSLAGSPALSHAYLGLVEVLQAKASSNKEVVEVADMYVGSLMEAFWVMNSAPASKGEKPQFCLPGDQALNNPELEHLGYFLLTKAKNAKGMQETLRKNPKFPASILLLNQLQETFPCPDEGKP